MLNESQTIKSLNMIKDNIEKLGFTDTEYFEYAIESAIYYINKEIQYRKFRNAIFDEFKEDVRAEVFRADSSVIY